MRQSTARCPFDSMLGMVRVVYVVSGSPRPSDPPEAGNWRFSGFQRQGSLDNFYGQRKGVFFKLQLLPVDSEITSVNVYLWF